MFQYADDTTLIVEDYKSVEYVMKRVKSICKCTGAKVNEEQKKCFYEIWRSA